jgi:hypothetical protein
VFAPGGGRIDLPAALEAAGGWHVELRVELFHRRVPMRLLAARLPDEQAAARRARALADARKRGWEVSRDRLALCGWNVLLTNDPSGLLSVREAWDVRRVRWQEELLFKGMKSGGGGLGRSRSSKPWRVACEV